MRECKRNTISKWIFLENLRSKSFILKLCYQHHVTDIKFLCLKERSNMAVAPSLRVTIYFCKKILFAVITWNKKDSSKQVVSMINKLGKEFFAAATFKGSWDVYFETKACSILWSVWVFFAFLEKRWPEKHCLLEVNLVFHM